MIERLIPVSIATTCAAEPSPRMIGSLGVTSLAKSAPFMLGSASICARASDSLTEPSKIPPRIAPLSRMWRTSERVLTPVIPGMPCSTSQASQSPWIPGRSGGRDLAHHDRAGMRARQTP